MRGNGDTNYLLIVVSIEDNELSTEMVKAYDRVQAFKYAWAKTQPNHEPGTPFSELLLEVSYSDSMSLGFDIGKADEMGFSDESLERGFIIEALSMKDLKWV